MSQIQIFTPPPTNWQDFQFLVAEIARTKYDPDSVQEFGRQGQKQYGVDVYATDYSDRKIGIQCKETKVNGLCKKIIEKEISQARNFSPMLDFYIIATTQRLEEVAGTHNISRRKLINVINKELTRTGQMTIDTAY
jgi:hypothetical protein